ncbi:MAG: competence/damage-inducible protein A [Flavobacteriales bacterium]|jgi:nicotinamide-nucleotide amidase|nr:competence/damage-inducible protein A [Flavobacteriales bacterium]
MLAEIITIGDELLIGQTIDTNSAWIGEQLSLIGISVQQISSITDNEQHIIKALDTASDRADIIIMTGGLGPTKDDITKHTLCNYFDTELELNTPILERLKARYAAFNVPLNEANRAQAMLPKSCTVLPNTRGSASGMWFEKNGKVYISLPGVPYEMKGILSDEGFPKLVQHFQTPTVLHRTIRTIGIPESKLAERIEDWENDLKEKGLSLAYLPSPGFVRLRISGVDHDGTKSRIIEEKVATLLDLLGDAVYGFEKEILEEVIGQLLTDQNKTISLAESCTGGTIAKLLTNISGSSVYFKGGIVSYANEIKINVLQVSADDIKTHGAVSQTVVEQMATNVRSMMETDYAISTSGIAGPTGGTKDKPVGTIWMAVSSAEKTVAKKYLLPYNNRARNIIVAANYALELLRKEFLI